MKITVLTLFPDMFDSFAKTSIIKHAIQKKLVDLEIINFREYSTYKHQKVDDTPFGGSAGMLLMLDPIVRCLEKIKTEDAKVYILSPEGIRFNQTVATKIAQEIKHLVLIAGHYEGFDYRLNHYIDGAISVGDYILTGGELPAMTICDAVIRLIPGVINHDSLVHESFETNLLDHPSYTRPAVYEGHAVPEVLLSGNHKLIAEFNHAERLRITQIKRPDLYEKYLEKMKGKK